MGGRSHDERAASFWKPRFRITLDATETRRGILRSYEQLVGPSFGCPLCAMPSCSIVGPVDYRYECRNRMACGWSQRSHYAMSIRSCLGLGAPTEGLPCLHLMRREQDGPAQISSRSRGPVALATS